MDFGAVKRGSGGVYHAVSRKYLQTHLNEYSFRYNRRDAGVPIVHFDDFEGF